MRADIPKSPLVVMCLTFGTLALALAVQVLFASNDPGGTVDTSRQGTSVHAEQGGDTEGARPNPPLITFNGAGWPSPVDDPYLIREAPLND